MNKASKRTHGVGGDTARVGQSTFKPLGSRRAELLQEEVTEDRLEVHTDFRECTKLCIIRSLIMSVLPISIAGGKRYKGKGAQLLIINTSQSYGVSPAIWDHTVLAATQHRWTCSTLPPARQACTQHHHQMQSNQPKRPAIAIIHRNGLFSASSRAYVAVTPVSRQIWWIQVVGGLDDRWSVCTPAKAGHRPSSWYKFRGSSLPVHHFEV